MLSDEFGLRICCVRFDEEHGENDVGGGVAVGEYSGLGEAVEATVRRRRVFEPDPANARAYAERFALYREVYPTFKDLAHRM